MLRKRFMRISVVMALMASLIITSQITVLAAAPSIEEIEHKGKGRVEVDFHGKVKYKKVKVTVKDSSGKKYSVKKIRKDDDDIRFTIKKFKTGKTYKITVKGVKSKGTGKYGKVKGTLNVPGTGGAAIDGATAQSTAMNHAASTWGTTGIFELKVERDFEAGTEVWEVDFKGYENGVLYEYDYKIAVKGGQIIRFSHEIED